MDAAAGLNDDAGDEVVCHDADQDGLVERGGVGLLGSSPIPFAGWGHAGVVGWRAILDFLLQCSKPALGLSDGFALGMRMASVKPAMREGERPIRSKLSEPVRWWRALANDSCGSATLGSAVGWMPA